MRLVDSTNTYLKTVCLVANGVDFATAQASCATAGMELFTVDSATSASTQAFLSFADSFDGVYYSNPYRLWVNYGQCTDFSNNAGAYSINIIPCTERMYFVCEFF